MKTYSTRHLKRVRCVHVWDLSAVKMFVAGMKIATLAMVDGSMHSVDAITMRIQQDDICWHLSQKTSQS